MSRGKPLLALSFTHSLPFTQSHTHTLSLSLSYSLSLWYSLPLVFSPWHSLSLSLSHTHTLIQTHSYVHTHCSHILSHPADPAVELLDGGTVARGPAKDLKYPTHQ